MGLLTPLSLLVTDLDNTLVGNDRALDRLNQVLHRYRQTWGTKIVYATGRSRASYQDLATTKPLMVPDALIAAVGTEIYLSSSELPDREWVDKLGSGWHREEIVTIASRFADLAPQPAAEQRPYKVSYYLSASVVTAVVPRLQELLSQQGLDVEVIYSGSKDLDILPRGGDKGTAVQFLRDRWQIEPSQTVVCGDSGNDIALFKYGRERGIIVGNAQSELRLWHELHPVDYHYLAVAGYADGMMEGLRYFRFIA
ncbi:sucrose-phosphate phosphatase [Chamaesiphon sp.]|uniref:sucrose-phosphate phosphatase n=1 Tax=Chamaesiphon sp. TaxID=2814140 RepID=UPI003593467F